MIPKEFIAAMAQQSIQVILDLSQVRSDKDAVNVLSIIADFAVLYILGAEGKDVAKAYLARISDKIDRCTVEEIEVPNPVDSTKKIKSRSVSIDDGDTFQNAVFGSNQLQ